MNFEKLAQQSSGDFGPQGQYIINAACGNFAKLVCITTKNIAAASGIIRPTDKPQPKNFGCFVAGTLVYTDKGLVPIETIRVGTLVLSRPERGGELGYRRVINKVSHLDQEVYAVQVKVAGVQQLTTIIATGNHPFWIADPETHAPLVNGEHWMAAECLEPGLVVQLTDGSHATIYAAGLIRRTQHAHIGFAADDRAGVGIVLDIANKQILLADETLLVDLGTLELGEAFVAPVYNFEVEEFHTYFVGDAGVWVHNTNCPKGDEGIARIADKVEDIQRCFYEETAVHCRDKLRHISRLEVGDEVLSRCEKTGVIALKRITKVYEHECTDLFVLWPHYPSKPVANPYYGEVRTPLYASSEHPVWVEGKGWTCVRELKIGDEFITFNGEKLILERIDEEEDLPCSVYNIEVEDFHTYFVHYCGIWVHNKGGYLDEAPGSKAG